MPDNGITPEAPAPAAFSVRLEGDTVLVCSGELDLAAAPALRRSLERVLRLAPARVVVDLRQVSFFDASAISELVRARNSCRAASGDLVVRSASPSGRRVLGIVGLTDLVAEAPSAAELWSTWEAACATARYGAAPLVFDRTAMLATITALTEDPSSISASDLSTVVAAHDGASAAVAVMQLWALRDVLHSWIGPRSERQTALAAMASSALAALEQATLLDPLTGLLNRRALDRDLLQSLAAARRHRQCLSVVMVDVEGLKATNDQLGHAAGDDTLRAVATNLTSALRAGDDAYRIGGDEFVLVLPELRPDDIGAVMARAVVGARGAFTWGCAWIEGDDAAPVAQRAARLLQQADQRMLDHRALVRGGHAEPGAVPEPPVVLAGRFSAGSRSAVVIEEAKGLVAEHFDISIDGAATMLRAFAAAQGQPLLDAAGALVDRSVDVARLAPHRPGQPDAHAASGAVAGAPSAER